MCSRYSGFREKFDKFIQEGGLKEGGKAKGKFEFHQGEREKMVSMVEQLFAPRVITREQRGKKFKQSVFRGLKLP